MERQKIGRLRFKGAKIAKSKASNEIKKIKDRSREDSTRDTLNVPSSADKASTVPSLASASGNSLISRDNSELPIVNTEAQLKFEEMRRLRLRELVRTQAAVTHRERVREYNAKLEKLSEHHDMPKIGPG